MSRFHRFIKPRPAITEAGFTLPEKMVIVAIIGILAAASAPSMLAALNRAKVKQTMAAVRSALNETQREAIKGNKICTLTLDFVEGKVTGPCLVNGDRTLDTNVTIATNLTDPNSSTASEDSQPVLIGSDVQPSLGLNDGENISQIALVSDADSKAEAAKAGVVVQIIAEKCKGNTSKGLGLGTCKDKDKDGNNDEDDDNDSPANSGTSSSIPIKYGVLGNPEFAIVSANQTPNDPSGKIVFFDPTHTQGAKHCIAISNTLGLTRIGTYQGDTKPTAITDTGRCTAEQWEEQ